ncbi:septum formation initiator family protein [candidate division KSB1 bacterium]|nr:septum formation initiator family protein [candidate division KSB1 bacterium]
MKNRNHSNQLPARFFRQPAQRKPKVRAWRHLTWLICAVLLYGAYAYVGGSSGLIQYVRLLQRRSKTDKEIVTLQTRQDSLHQVIRLLQTDTTYIEKVARERYYMGKPGEKIYTVIKQPRTESSK